MGNESAQVLNAKKARLRELEDIKSIMQHEHGRRFLYRQLEIAGIYTTSYGVESPEKHIYFREGQRNMGLWLLSEIQQSSPVLYLKMLGENDNVIQD